MVKSPSKPSVSSLPRDDSVPMRNALHFVPGPIPVPTPPELFVIEGEKRQFRGQKNLTLAPSSQRFRLIKLLVFGSLNPHGHGKEKSIELKGHSDSVDQLCWDPKHDELIATASGDKTVRLWDACRCVLDECSNYFAMLFDTIFIHKGGKCSQQTELSGENINITYKPNGTHIAVGNRDDEITIMDVSKFKAIHKRMFNYEVNEIAWNTTGDLFFLTIGYGIVEVLSYPSLRPLHTLMAHTAGCYCIGMDPLGRYFAVGSADSLVSLWDLSEMLCVRIFTKLEWPVRTISFNHTREYIAFASEDMFIDISNVQTGRSIHQINCRAANNSVEWNPKYNLLACAGDDKNKYQADEGVFHIFGFQSA